MKSEPSNTPTPTKDDVDLRGAEAALRRAAERARERARQTGHEPVVSDSEASSTQADLSRAP